MPGGVSKGKRRVVVADSDDDKSEEIPDALETSQPKTKRKQTKGKTPKSRKIALEEEDDLDGFIVNDEDDIDAKPSRKKAGSKTRVSKKSQKSKVEIEPKEIVVKKEKKVENPTVEKRKVSGAYRPKWLGPERDPPKHGSKPIPIGKPNCLSNIPFVLTGLNESLTRDETTELITKYGGLVRTAVSGKTKYLVAGFEMEDGRPITEGSKYKQALAKGTTIINEDQLLDMIRQSNPEESAKAEAKQQLAIKKEEDTELKNEEVVMNNHIFSSQSRLFTVKYAPSNSGEILGNKDVINNLRSWLTQWDDVVIHQSIVVQHNRQNPDARGALLSGPPGIGKTTTAHVLGKECGYEVIEFNASDKRNALSVRNALRDVVFTRTLNAKKRLVIMDEVDGMSTGDRGGIVELTKIIKSSLIPIICICNDRESQKVRPLTSCCYDLTFSKPSANTIVNRLLYICNKESIQASKDELSALVEATDGDIRQCLNKLQMVSSVDSKDASLSVFNQDRFLDHTAFDVAKHLLVESTKYSFNERYNLFFNDYSMTPLVIEQNYLDSIKSKRYKEETSLEIMADAADSICDLENIQNSLMRENNWKLLPAVASMAVRTGVKSAGSYLFTKFPAFYGKLSKSKKSRRLMTELYTHLSSNISSSVSSISMDYYESLSSYLIDPLLKEDVDECIERLDEYGLTRDDLVEGLNYIPLGEGKSLFDMVPTKVKTALTRKYSKKNHLSSNIYSKEEELVLRTQSRQSKKREGEEVKRGSKKEKIEEDFSSESTDEEANYYVY